ncbi:hypothetical protein [Sphingopyxis sp. MSC1_008]|jgi:hypothetical protein|uniref:hypothetical protein n=1 Tax=Sphingopyxis sp. MSC1_008 TaxID=2909265 RepID=UPI0020BE1C9F|nr:hypothetical protein [Sphingopyxis sp. MSC1_008]
MILFTLSRWLLLGKHQTDLTAPKPPPPRRIRLEDIGHDLKSTTKRRFYFGNADAMLSRKFEEGRLFNEMSEEYDTVARRHQPQCPRQLANEPTVFQSEVDHFLRSGSCP